MLRPTLCALLLSRIWQTCSVMYPQLQHPESGSTTLKNLSWLLTYSPPPAPCKFPAITHSFTVAQVLSFPECRVIGISVLVCSGCCHKIRHTRWLINNRNLFLTLGRLEVSDPGSRVTKWSLGSRTQTSCVPMWSETSFFMRLTPLMGAPLHNLSPSQGLHPLVSSHLRVRISTYEFGGDRYWDHSI